MKKRIISLVLCLCMLLALAPAASADGGNYLALGDSISTGYGLADASTEGFAEIVAAEAGYALANFAVNGNTADGILAQLASGELDEAVAVADVITITCGGNDLMAALYTAVVDTYNASAAEDAQLAPEEVTAVMTDSTDPRYFDLLLTAQSVLSGSESKGIPPFAETAAFVTALETYVTNLHNAVGELRSRNADARILVATQYHPYATFSGMYAILNNGVAPGVAALNEAIVSTADVIGYEVADVFTAFDAAAAEGTNLCNATTSPLELDFHPNAAGHAVIAEVMLAALAGETVTEPTTEPTVVFTDVAESDWFYDEVYAAAGVDVIAGNPDGTFRPLGKLSWAHTVAFAVRLAQLKAGEHVYGPADQYGQWYDVYVEYALDNGIIYEVAEDATAEICRGDAAVIFAAVLGDAEQINDVADGYFTDAPTDGAVHDAIYALARAGIINGIRPGEFGVNSGFQRCQAAAIVARLAGLVDPVVIGS